MLVKKCCDWKMKPTCAIHFVEFSQSVLRLIPSVSIYEHRVSKLHAGHVSAQDIIMHYSKLLFTLWSFLSLY